MAKQDLGQGDSVEITPEIKVAILDSLAGVSREQASLLPTVHK